MCGPHIATKRNIDKLEAFQRRAARFVTSNYSYTSSVTAMMETLNWNTLHARRNILRLIMLYTIWLISLYQNLLLLQLLLIIQLCKRSQFTFQQNQCIQVTNNNMIGVHDHDVDNNANIELPMCSYTFIVEYSIGSTVSVRMS